MCPQGCGGSSPPFGTMNRQAGTRVSVLGDPRRQREYFGSTAAASAAGFVTVSVPSIRCMSALLDAYDSPIEGLPTRLVMQGCDLVNDCAIC